MMILTVFALSLVSPSTPAHAEDALIKCESIAVDGDTPAENDALRKCDVAKVSCDGVTYYLDKNADTAPKATLDVVDADGNPVQICSSKSHPIPLQLDLNLLDSTNSESAEAVSSLSAHLDEANASLHASGLSEGYALQACAPLIHGPGTVGERIKSCIKPDFDGKESCDGSSSGCGQFCWCQKGIGTLGLSYRTRHVPPSGTCPANLKDLELDNPPSDFKAFSLRISGKVQHLAFTRAQLEALEIKPLGPTTAFSCFYDCKKESSYFAQQDVTGTFCSATVSQCTGVSFKRDEPVRPLAVSSDGLMSANCLTKSKTAQASGFPLGRANSVCPEDIDRCMNNPQFWSYAPEFRSRLDAYGTCMRGGNGYSACLDRFESSGSSQLEVK